MNTNPRILSLCRSKLTENRGTPIRVRSLLAEFLQDPDIFLVTASWDQTGVFETPHIYMTNRPLYDLVNLIKVVRKYNITVIIGHTISTWYYLLFFHLFTHCKIVLEMHGFVEEEAKLYGSISNLRFAIDRFFYQMVYRVCDLITTCSETASEELRRFNPQVITLYGGVDTTLFNSSVSPAHAHTLGKIVIGYAGNGRVWQGVPFLVDAYQELSKRTALFQLHLLLSERKNLILPPEVVVSGPVTHEEVPHFLQDYDILAIPRLENKVNRLSFPSKLPEYMAMGKPVVASRTSDMHRIITDGVDGLLYDPGDTEGFIQACKKLEDPVFREKLGRAARSTVENKFLWPTQATIFISNIRSL